MFAFRCDPPTTSLFDTKFLQSTKDNSSESTVTKEVTLPKCVKGIYFGAKWVCLFHFK